MEQIISSLIEQLEPNNAKKAKIIPWSSPIPSFGNHSHATIATVGINPSSKEFIDNSKIELVGQERRFHTLRSLGLNSWTEATEADYKEIAQRCNQYFFNNPYDRWFNVLEFLISGTNHSYYSSLASACHLDLIPFATSCKWSELNHKERCALFSLSGSTLGQVVRNSNIMLLILNGASVLRHFKSVCDVRFTVERMPDWDLPRRISPVAGYASYGRISKLSNINLEREVAIIGYNHNIQSSFGVTKHVKNSIQEWITETVQEILS